MKRYSTVLWVIILCCISNALVLAEIPRSLSVQGILSHSEYGIDRVHIIKTTLYSVVSDENILYTQLDTLYIEKNGLFSINLGKEVGLPLSIPFDKQYVVEFSVNGIIYPMRMPLQSVPYAITSEKVLDNSVELRHLSDGLKQQLQIQEDSKSGKGENTLANYVGGFRSVIAGGDENRTSANFSSILGGNFNSVSGSYGTVTGGQSNSVSGNWSFVGGGQNNRAFGSWSSVTAGKDNTIASSANFATIGGGNTNQVGASNGTISGGSSNIVTAQGGTVSGGQSNRAMQTFATVSGGQNNIASGQGSVTVGGMNNTSTSQYSIVSGGMNNDANAEFSSIAGGSENIIASSARSSFISGGSNNKINSGMNSGIMGSNNTITSSNNSFTMGTGNTITTASNGIGIGTENQVNGQNAIAIGTGNIAYGNNEMTIGTYSSTSINPANVTNASFTGNRRFSVGIGSSSGQRKNAITVFDHGHTLIQGKLMVTDTAFLNIASIQGNTSIDGSVNIAGNLTIGGILSTSGTFTSSNLSGTNTGDVTIGTANGLSLTGQALSLAVATTTAAGAMSSSDKTKLDGIVTGAEVNVNADWNAVSGDAEILNKPTLGTMSSETAIDYYTNTQTDAGFQAKDVNLTTVATIGTSDQLLKVKNDGSGLEWFTPSYISSYTETDPQVGTIVSSGIPRWNGNALVTGSLSDDGTNISTSGTFTSSNLSGTNTGDITIGTGSGLSLTSQALSLASATITAAGAMSSSDKTKLDGIATGAEVNVNADWNAVSGDAEILNKPTLGTMSAESVSDYYTKTQSDVGFQVKDADLTTVATIGSSDQLLKVMNDGSGLEWFTPSYISSYTETDPQVGTIVSSGIPRWNGTALVTGSLSDDGTNLTTFGIITASNLSGTNTGDITIGTASGLSLTGQALSLASATTTAAGAMSASDKTKLDGISGTNTGDITLGTVNGLSLSGQVLSLDTATITSNGAMTYHDKVKLNALSNHNSSGPFSPTNVTAEQRNALANVEAGMIAFCSDCGLQGELQYYSGTNWATFTGYPVASMNGFLKIQVGSDLLAISQSDNAGKINSVDLSYDGSVLAVGYPSNGTLNTNGLVKVFKWNGSSWNQYGSDIIGEGANDQFGAAVSISNNGKTLAIGAPQNDGGGLNAGSVRIYNWDGISWSQEGSDIDGNSANLLVGTNVEISGDGKLLAILSSNSIFRFYKKNGSTWSQVNSDIGLGRSLSFSFDGKLVAVSDINHVNVYYDNGTDWTKKGGSHLDVNSETMANVSINHDGNIIAIGIPFNDANGNNAGMLRVMEWNGFAWIKKGTDILGESADDYFGFTVSLSSDGKKLIAGALYNNGNGNDSGHARVFQWNGENWIQQSSDIDGVAADDKCGSSVVISGDGTRVAVGAPENDNVVLNGGHVRVFK